MTHFPFVWTCNRTKLWLSRGSKVISYTRHLFAVPRWRCYSGVSKVKIRGPRNDSDVALSLQRCLGTLCVIVLNTYHFVNTGSIQKKCNSDNTGPRYMYENVDSDGQKNIIETPHNRMFPWHSLILAVTISVYKCMHVLFL